LHEENEIMISTFLSYFNYIFEIIKKIKAYY